MRGRRWQTHAIFECRTCGKRWEDYKGAQHSARTHAKKYKHDVRGEIGTAVYYDGGESEGERR